MKIDRLKIVGFKSFADPVEIPIGEGITGIVGPNGCGKSNLIEALRWAMGETSAKRMRADGMDDVIFGGTDTRPPRSSCEVTISIDNSERLAPSEFNADPRLDVGRRIERGEGSSYKVNGKPARARDVQVLFKDAGVGAGSSALVSQGKVGAIINAKPSERRNILEEAAGVAGLASRRHEAELRLKGTEQNLERAEDMERGLSEQLASLRRQARQARRRKDIDGLIRAAEAAAFLVRWRSVSLRAEGTDAAFKANEDSVMACMIETKKAEAELAAAEVSAAPAVKARMEAETELALARAKVESVRKEAQQARAALASAQKTVERTKADLEREKASIGNSGEEYEELKDRKAIAEDDREYDAVLIENESAKVIEAKERMELAVETAQTLAEELAATRAGRQAAERRLEEAKSRHATAITKLQAAVDKAEEARRRLAALPAPSGEVAAAEERVAEAEATVSAAAVRISEAIDAENEAKSLHGGISARLSAARAELAALSSGRPEKETAGSLMKAEPGYEQAAAAAFGEGVSAGLGGGESRWWEGSHVRISHPTGTKPLSAGLAVPPELEAARSGIGIAETREHAEEVSKGLQPGQAVVTPDGLLWRWDGFRSGVVAAAAEEIRRAARQRQLEIDVSGLKDAESQTARHLSVTSEALRAATEAVDKAKNLHRKFRAELDALRAREQGVERERAELETRISSAADTEAALREAAEAEAAVLDECQTALSALPSFSGKEADLEEARRKQSECSGAYERAREALDKVRRDAEARILLIQNLDQQMKDFNRRIAAARELIAELGGRLEEAEQEAVRLSNSEALAPDAEEEAREELERAAVAHEAAVEEARQSEERVAAARMAAKESDAKLSALREDRARLLAELKAAKDASQELAREIGERLEVSTAELGAIAGIGPEDDLPDLQACEGRVQRLARERDTIGTVNLLAEDQVAEVEAKLGEANKSRDELREAVRRLRSTIAEFDREARERLTEAFALIDSHFRDLFSRLFRGGHAYLKLSGSEDILEAGLEIYACPPGKKLQTMSLLSGGEQAMAALALIFAAFLIRPAPVCVLDEVDAPLDDANIDRLCSLVTEMSKDCTRFLVVTHHALTMSRCNRLYGVTMMERGVSRLTAVDVDSAVKMVES